MSSGVAPTNPVSTVSSAPAELWHKLLTQELQRSPEFTEQFYERLRAAKLTFGNRVHCPFLRPFFLSPEDEQRVRAVAEKIAELGERVANHAMKDASLLAQLHLREGELRLVRLGKPHGFASTASRLDSFLLPDALKFAEYNGESPAGSGYSETLAGVFRELPLTHEFAKDYEMHSYPLSAKLLDALVMAYLDWGGTSKKPQMLITDWHEVPTWSEFEILKARFENFELAPGRHFVPVGDQHLWLLGCTAPIEIGHHQRIQELCAQRVAVHFVVFREFVRQRQFAKDSGERFAVPGAGGRFAVVFRKFQRIRQQKRIQARRGAGKSMRFAKADQPQFLFPQM